jgi:hypothetical protein
MEGIFSPYRVFVASGIDVSVGLGGKAVVG